jgi:hypothetical protein
VIHANPDLSKEIEQDIFYLNGPQYVGEIRGLTSLSQFLGLYSLLYRASTQVPNVALPLNRDPSGVIRTVLQAICLSLICKKWQITLYS